MTFQNRTVLITGAAGQLGRAVAQHFASQGANLALVDVSQPALQDAIPPGLGAERVLTLPTSQPSCGISLMAGPMQEERLLRLGMAAERALA